MSAVRGLLPIALLGLSACASSTERQGLGFVERDALGEAEDSAWENCNRGPYTLIKGRRGYSPNDYRCTPPAQAPVATASPSP